MIVFFYGEETYRTTQKMHELKERFLKKNPSGSGMMFFDCDEKCDISSIVGSLNAQNLFVQNQLIVIKNIFQHTKATEQEGLIAHMSQDTSDVIVFLEQGAVRKNALLYKWLIGHAKTVFESKMLNGAELEKWIMKRVSDQNGSIDSAAVRELILFLDNDLWRISCEIEKLVAYAYGRTLTEQDVHMLVHGKMNADIFATVDAMVAGDKKNALAQLRKQILSGDDEFRIFGMMAYHIRTLLTVASAADVHGTTSRDVISKATGIHMFVVQKALQATRHISVEKLKKMHADLASFDREIKKGERDVGSAIDLFVMNI